MSGMSGTARKSPKAIKPQSIPTDKVLIGKSGSGHESGIKRFFKKTGNKIKDVLKSDTTKSILKWAGIGISAGAIGGAMGGAIMGIFVGAPIAVLLEIGGMFTGTAGVGTAFVSEFTGAMAVYGGGMGAVAGGAAGAGIGAISEAVKEK